MNQKCNFKVFKGLSSTDSISASYTVLDGLENSETISSIHINHGEYSPYYFFVFENQVKVDDLKKTGNQFKGVLYEFKTNAGVDKLTNKWDNSTLKVTCLSLEFNTSFNTGKRNEFAITSAEEKAISNAIEYKDLIKLFENANKRAANYEVPSYQTRKPKISLNEINRIRAIKQLPLLKSLPAQGGKPSDEKILYKGHNYKIRKEGRSKFIVTKAEGVVPITVARKWLKEHLKQKEKVKKAAKK
jgi:hypothetical protein